MEEFLTLFQEVRFHPVQKFVQWKVICETAVQDVNEIYGAYSYSPCRMNPFSLDR